LTSVVGRTFSAVLSAAGAVLVAVAFPVAALGGAFAAVFGAGVAFFAVVAGAVSALLHAFSAVLWTARAALEEVVTVAVAAEEPREAEAAILRTVVAVLIVRADVVSARWSAFPAILLAVGAVLE
jgi:hypothetical protein